MSSSESTVSISSDECDEQHDNLELKGDIINNYNIIYELGRGSFSIVWLGFNIVDNKFYAIKIQHPDDFDEGKEEIDFVKKLPKENKVFNHLIEEFTEIRDYKKYLCSVWELHCCNLDYLLRKDKYINGFETNQANNIMRQLVESLYILHTKYKTYHGDIKTDNILVKGLNEKDLYIINKYKSYNFFEVYTKAKKQFLLDNNRKLSQLDKLKKKDKLVIRKKVHNEITNLILKDNLNKSDIDSKYLETINISLADFGSHCHEDDEFNGTFGTRYYQAPEIILKGDCSFPVDIWALGCTYYELLTGNILFDPDKDSKYSRDYYHLSLINDTCGDFNKDFLKETKKYKEFFTSKYKLKDYEKPEINRLERKLKEFNITNDNIKNLLKKMLEINPNKRIKIKELYEIFCK